MSVIPHMLQAARHPRRAAYRLTRSRFWLSGRDRRLLASYEQRFQFRDWQMVSDMQDDEPWLR